MKILSPQQIRELDRHTIEKEGIRSIDLMERAAQTFVNWFVDTFPVDENPTIQIVCGTGNNGGDGLAVARLLYRKFYQIELFLCKISEAVSDDFALNLKALPQRNAIPITEIKSNDPLFSFAGDIIIDAIFGAGLNRPVEGYWATLFEQINRSAATVVSIDLPSGLFANQVTKSAIVKADYTFTFELLKLSFLYPENFNGVNKLKVGVIGLDVDYLKELATDFHYLTTEMIKKILQPRQKFDHKGTYGHALIIAGSYGKMGAATLAARACLRAGCGLVSVHVPRSGYEIIQIAFPEAMAQVDRHKQVFSQPPALNSYQTIGVGPGIGTNKITVSALGELLEKATTPLVVDADALNILAKNKSLLKSLPANSILTPHPKEFERLFGKSEDDFARNDLQRKQAKALNCIIVLKGAHTCIATPAGTCFFNSTGNPGMGTAGTGDVLTGIITGLLAQGYLPVNAAKIGVFLHGLAGDIAAEELDQESLLATDVIEHLGKAFKVLRTK